ncbi:MAG: site-specific DNA-methyltransferase [Bacteroidia bacterium]|nr:site-specific DNA-methyltransferase [Bacteroidia bacterium]
MRKAYTTQYGSQIIGDSLDVLRSYPDDSIDLVFTSPPFALLRKKEYGNEDQSEYIEWLLQFGILVFEKLKPTGSFVLDLGGAYKSGLPVRSLYNFRIPIEFCDKIGFYLAEDFYWYNPSKLPSPIEWVNKKKIRVKDAVNNVWWFSKTPYPKADVTKVLTPYSDRMKKLLENPEDYYTPKERPSGHNISANFTDNGGAIPPNLLQIPNSESNSHYLTNCKKAGLIGHPARFPSKLPEFFIKYLTDKGDFVVDIFSGSNTTGSVAEMLKREWNSIELDASYAANSSFRFLPKTLSEKDLLNVYFSILAGKEVKLMDFLMNGREVPSLTKDFIISEKLNFENLSKMSKHEKNKFDVLEKATSILF